MVQRYDMTTTHFYALNGDWVRYEDYYVAMKAIRKTLSILENESDIFLAVSRAEDELRKALAEAGEEA